MAVDEALLRLVHVPTLRVYGWDAPALSIGYFDSCKDLPPDRPFVRRFTGGGLVDHTRDLTYSIIVPREHPLNQAGPQESYCLIHQAVALALETCGSAATVAEQPPEARGNACFQKPVKFDVVQGTNKLAGAAQRRTREGCLHQGSILPPQHLDLHTLTGALILHQTGR
ncbi:MAG: lipoate--protein ligase family protein, partial [Verrucomicrobiia bacterium]